MLSYAKTLIGIPYRWWNPAVSCSDTDGPFYAVEGGEVPLEVIQRGHLNCAGLVNVLCRKFGKEIPGAKERDFYAGGTGLWWKYFEQQGVLETFDPAADYPVGSLLLRPYATEEDQGHLAIWIGGKTILHSWPEGGVILQEVDPTYYKAVVKGFFKN